MRLIMIGILALFLAGCTPSHEFDVSLSDVSHSDIYDDVQNKTLDVISFILTNNERSVLVCDVLTSLDNSTNSSVMRGHVGFIAPGSSKNVSVRIDMFYGDTDLSIEPLCSKP